ncbi:MAG: hypothetical protein GDA56_03875 [Hormoscilla sp. GM7CHS1pb]|nr:hypothetical protein [Hormoscilla sp. GM7CHS1pb]
MSFKSSSAGLYLINASDYGVLKDINGPGNRYWNFDRDSNHIRVSDEEHGSVPLLVLLTGWMG